MKTRTTKKIICLFLSAIVFSVTAATLVFPASAATPLTATQVQNKIDEYYAAVSKDGTPYWNMQQSEQTLKDYANAGNYAASVQHDNGCEGKSVKNDTCHSNEFGGAWQCFGFAKYMCYVIYGSYPSKANGVPEYTPSGLNGSWYYYKNDDLPTSIQPGDMIRWYMGSDSQHAVVVDYTLSDGTIYCIDCNHSSGLKDSNGKTITGTNGKCVIDKCKVKYTTAEIFGLVQNGVAYICRYGGVRETSRPTAPAAPTVKTDGLNVTVSWNDVADETGYSVYLLQAPWGWSDIKYTAGLPANTTSFTFMGVAAGDYCAFVIARPNEDSVQSGWTSFTVTDPPPSVAPAAPQIQVSGTEYLEGETVSVSWGAVSNAAEYIYYVSEFPEGYAYTNSVRSGTTTSTSIFFNDLPSGAYCVFVHAVSSAGLWSSQSNWLSFKVRNDDYAASHVIVRNDHLYALYEAPESWTYAMDLCVKLGGHLATVTDAEESAVIAELLTSATGDGYWLGASNHSVQDYNNASLNYTWVTGEAFSYSNWASGEPSGGGNEGTKEHFLEVRKSYGNTWNDLPNRSTLNNGFILEIDNLSSIQPTYTETRGNSQYQVFDIAMTWTEAKAFCESIGGHLVTVQSGEEYTALVSIMAQGNRFWYYLGGARTDVSGTGMWLDGTTISNTDSNIVWSAFDNGNYLFSYKIGGLGWMKSAYHPLNELASYIGFVCEFDNVAHLHELTHIDRKEATTLTEGNIEYWHCAGCGKYFADSEAANEITLSDTIIPVVSSLGEITIDSITASDKLYVSYSIRTIINEPVTAFCAAYDKDGRIMDITTNSIAQATVNESCQISFALSSKAVDHYKVFFVSSKFTPLSGGRMYQT